MPEAREIVPGMFAWVFDSPLMRRVLADGNVGAVPAVFRASAGLSLYEVADLAGRSRHAIGSYELGKRGALHDDRAFGQFAAAVDLPYLALLPYWFRDPGIAVAGGRALAAVLEALGVEMSRRDLGGLAVVSMAAAMLPEVPVPSRVTSAHIRYLHVSADTLYRQDQAVGGAALLLAGLRSWRRARRMLRESGCTEDIKRQLYAVTVEMGVCAGWVALSAGDHALARRLYAEARSVAGEAGKEARSPAEEAENRVLTAHALTNSSMLANYVARTGPDRGPARDSLRLACQAADVAHRAPAPRLRAQIAFRHAVAASLLGDKAAFRSAITRARRELDQAPRASEPGWGGLVDETQITGEEAVGYANLGEFARGEKLFHPVLGDGGLSPRRRANYGSHLALSLLGQGAHKDAIAAATTVLSVFESGVTSGLALNNLRPVRIAARRADDEEFCTRYDAAERTLTAV